MSRLMKNCIDNALITADSQLNILLFGKQCKFAQELISGSKNSFYTFYNYESADNVYIVNEEYMTTSLSINMNLVVSVDPIDEPSTVKNIAMKLKVPCIFIFNEMVDLPTAKKLHVGHAFADLNTVTTDKKITDDVYLYHSPTNTENWDNYFYEILNNHS